MNAAAKDLTAFGHEVCPWVAAAPRGCPAQASHPPEKLARSFPYKGRVAEGREGSVALQRRQNLGAVVGDGEGMLELRRAPAVGGADDPAILAQPGLWAAFVEHRLDGEDHARANLGASAYLADVGDERVFVQRAANTVAAIFAHDAVALTLGVLLDG